eukprot:TRINITY_DN2036_c0_g1_i3.p1 TRINITY_DN2036_c0_g1~~TRINITY_DN2036_c0_g1_i3.p1  ORF type:complete len:146 (-),score=22.75 TRINITY_DN2036_c0_g1_i3:72-509(-)
MCIRDRYQRRVHGKLKIQKKIMKKLNFFFLGFLLTGICCKNLANDMYYQMKGFAKRDHALDVEHYQKKVSDDHLISHVYFGKTIDEQLGDPKFHTHLLEMPKNGKIAEQCLPQGYPDYFKFLSNALASMNSANNTAALDLSLIHI